MKKRTTASTVEKSQQHFSDNCLWLYRKRMDYTQQQVAVLLGNKTTSHLSAYEHGNRLPNFKTALKLEIILRVPAAFLYRDLYTKLKRDIRQAEESLQSHL